MSKGLTKFMRNMETKNLIKDMTYLRKQDYLMKKS